MSYFVTGGTGFIGRNLIEYLLKRDGDIHVLVRKGSENKFDELKERFPQGKNRIKAVKGDLTKASLGLTKKDLKRLKGKIGHFFHLAAIYDITNDDEQAQMETNVEGTRNAVHCAGDLDAGCFHHTSSIAAAGLFRGYFREDMFEEAENYQQPYFLTKHESEKVVRNECPVPWRVYRPGIVVGHSKTGEIDKVDGPYYFFKALQLLRKALPPWVPVAGVEGSQLNVVPVDYVAAAMDHLAHKPDLDSRCFHLTDPHPLRVGKLIDVFARAAHAPQFAIRVDSAMFGFIPKNLRDLLLYLPPVQRLLDGVLNDLDIPRHVLRYITYPTRFDCRDALKELEGSGIACPRLEDYAWVLWDYWERHLDPDLLKDRTLRGAVEGKVVVITGASSGIGRAAALKVGAAGAKTILVARTRENLVKVQKEIEALGGKAYVHTADLSEPDDCDKLVTGVLKEQGHVDILINNAGRSIRRSISLSYERFHDFERLMRTNYFGPLKLILGFLPVMTERRKGHIINISSIGVQVHPPRFSAYVASKSALESFSRIAQPEFLDKNVAFTIINMPLVRTPMIGPTTFYQHVPTLSPDDAADLICKAIIRKPKRLSTRLGQFGQAVGVLFPRLGDVMLNASYQLFPDSKAAMGIKDAKDAAPSPEAVAFAALTRGVHW